MQQLFYYKMWQLLQNATFITSCDSTLLLYNTSMVTIKFPNSVLTKPCNIFGYSKRTSNCFFKSRRFSLGKDYFQSRVPLQPKLSAISFCVKSLLCMSVLSWEIVIRFNSCKHFDALRTLFTQRIQMSEKSMQL